jgi:tetraacyldisaccharide 4'-kinase
MSLKKPIFWDLKKPTLLSNLLYPFSYLVRFNNFINERKLKKKNDKIKTICIGNIYLGGTGKTPTSIEVYNLTKKINKKIAIGKKYYPAHNDENTILKNISNLILEKSRFDIIQKATKRKIKIIIFDDGLQDKEIDYDLKFVCFHSNNWIGNGRIIPSGPLRELKESLKKYDGVFLQNSFKPNMANSVIKSIKKINPGINIFKTKYQPINLNKLNRNKKYLIFSGIGNPENFKNLLLKNKIKIIKELKFPDHYNYTDNDIMQIKKMARSLKAEIVTTEKDYIKLNSNNKKNIKCLYVRIKILNQMKLINYIKSKFYG